MDRQFTLGVVIMITLVLIGIGAITPILLVQQSVQGWAQPDVNPILKAPVATSGNNIYIVWFNDKTPAGDGEVFFRVSTDGGKTFGEKINLSNTTGVDSINAEIGTSGDHVVVTWWERNQTANEPVMRISTNNGKTFGEKVMLSTDGPIG